MVFTPIGWWETQWDWDKDIDSTVNQMIYSTIYMCLVYIQKNINSHQISWCDLKFTYSSLFQSKPHVPIGYVSRCIPTIDYIVGFEPHVYWQNPLDNPLPLLPASCWKAAQCLTTGGYPCREKAEADLYTHKIAHIYNRHSTCRVCTIDFVNIIYICIMCVYIYMYTVYCAFNNCFGGFNPSSWKLSGDINS